MSRSILVSMRVTTRCGVFSGSRRTVHKVRTSHTLNMRRLRLIAVIFGTVFALSPFANAQVPELLPIPHRLDGHHREVLAMRRSQLAAQRDILVSKVEDHNRKCGKVPANTPLANECRQRMSALQGEIVAHNKAVKSFNDLVEGLVENMEARSRLFDWQKLKDGTYLGTGIGEEVAEWYADNYAATGSWLYGAGGLLASLWTPDTYLKTLAALATAEIGGSYFARTGATQATEAAGTSLAREPWADAWARAATAIREASSKTPDPPKWLRALNPRRIYHEGDEIVGYMDARGQIHILTGEGYAPAFNRAMQRAMEKELFSPGGKYYLPSR